MNIILLSGGSGKRLWPLSNDARSKQFLPLLDRGDGDMESMLQRVMRQIHESGLDAEVTLAAPAAQKDIIANQLGEETSVVLEPCRRDTFPAIVLSCSYLSLEKHLSDDEVVIVMPCDPYAGAGYFETLGKMAAAAGAGDADLVLMGVRPSYPSEKYGYIVPSEQDGAVLKVASFTEKPDAATARRLLDAGALWNGGVFAFRLGYVMSMVRKQMGGATFGLIRDRYEEFPTISFDYEVVEKASSVAVVPFNGNWKDLGTWNALTEEMPCNISGKALIGSECRNVHIINELGLPIFAEGLNDALVAACPDGILVCSKASSENIKQQVEKLSDRPMYEERRWGTYRVIDSAAYPDGHGSLTKSLTIKAGRNISYQVHSHRDEVWTFTDGEGLLMLDDVVTKVGPGYVAIIKRGQKHAVKAITDLTFIEVQSGGPLVEEDIERLQMSWPEEG